LSVDVIFDSYIANTNNVEMEKVTLLRKTRMSSSVLKCAGCCYLGHVDSKTWLLQLLTGLLTNTGCPA